MKIKFKNMKRIAIISTLFICLTASAQKKGVTMQDFQGLPGSWTGQLTYTDYSDDKKQATLQAKLEIVDRQDSLELSTAYTDPDGKTVADKGSLRIFDDGKQLFYDGNEFDIISVRRLGDRLTITADRDGKDNNKEAAIRETFIIGTGIFNITKQISYDGTNKFFVRNMMQFRKAVK